MPNSIKKIDYIFCKETGKDMFFRNLTSKPLGGIGILDGQSISFDKDPVVNLFIFVPKGEDMRPFYRHLGKGLLVRFKNEVEISAGYIRQGAFESILGIQAFSTDDPSILILQAREQEAGKAEEILLELSGNNYLDEGGHETVIFESRKVGREEFDRELEENYEGGFTTKGLNEVKAELESVVFVNDGNMVRKIVNSRNEFADNSDREDGRFKPKEMRISSELAKQLLEGLRESVEGSITKGRERK